MKPTHKFEIYSTTAGQTVAAALRTLLKNPSWTEAKRLVEARRVQINGNLCRDEARRLKKGDVLRIFAHPLAAPPKAEDITIRYMDEHLVVVEKPAGVNTQRHAEERNWSARRREKVPTLEEWVGRILAHRLDRPDASSRSSKIRRHGRRPPPARRPKPLHRVRAVHRLDRDTSGLMVFALSPEAERSLIGLFSRHDIDRVYHAVVLGHLRPMRIESQLVRDRGDGLRGSLPPGASAAARARHAVTHVKPLEHLGDRYTIVECRLETGRTHQIRIHLSEQGHMLCGEKTYCRRPDGAVVSDDSGAPRQALHAVRLGFVHPITGRRMQFDSSWPGDLASWLKQLKQRI